MTTAKAGLGGGKTKIDAGLVRNMSYQNALATVRRPPRLEIGVDALTGESTARMVAA